jgi:hypothetical protein
MWVQEKLLRCPHQNIKRNHVLLRFYLNNLNPKVILSHPCGFKLGCYVVASGGICVLEHIMMHGHYVKMLYEVFFTNTVVGTAQHVHFW